MTKKSQLNKSQVNIDNTNIDLYTYGKGDDAILVLHGFGSSINSWQELIQQFDPTKYTIYFPELPGFGGSDHPPVPWQVSNYTSYIEQLVQKLPKKPIYLVCHSFGGRISIQLLSKSSPQFQKAIFVAAAGIRPKLNPIQKLSNKLGPKIKPLKKFKLVQKILKLARKLIGAGDYNQVQGTMKQTFINVVNTDLTDHLSAIKTPTLLVWGDKDTYTPLYMGQKMNAEIPVSQLKIYPNMTHGVHLKAAKQLHKDIVEFLQS